MSIEEIHPESESKATPPPPGAHTYQDLSAEEARARLRRGETLRGFCIHRLSLSGRWESVVRIERCHLIQPRITRATFQETVLIVSSNVHNLEINQGVTFEKSLTFSGSRFTKARFQRFLVKGQFRAQGVQVDGQWTLLEGEFHSPVKFWQATFGGWTEFKRCVFHDQLDMRSTHVNEGLTLLDCDMRGEVLLRGASVVKKVDFGESQVAGLLDLSKAKLHDFTYLDSMRTGPEFRFALVNAVAERILIRPAQIENHLASEQKGSFADATREYGLLQSIFQTLHHHDEEDWAYYRFKVCQRRARPRSWLKPWTKIFQLLDWLFLDIGCGYGTNPFRAIGAAMVLMAIFGSLYAIGIHSFDIDDALIGSDVHSPVNRVAFGMVTSISVFTSGFTGDHLYHARGWMLLPLAVEALAGTLLWGFFIVAFSRKVIR